MARLKEYGQQFDQAGPECMATLARKLIIDEPWVWDINQDA